MARIASNRRVIIGEEDNSDIALIESLGFLVQRKISENSCKRIGVGLKNLYYSSGQL